jgi:hypothetical protein
VRQWYWCGVLGEFYGGAVESRHAVDFPECLAWIRDNALPPTRDATAHVAFLVICVKSAPPQACPQDPESGCIAAVPRTGAVGKQATFL